MHSTNGTRTYYIYIHIPKISNVMTRECARFARSINNHNSYRKMYFKPLTEFELAPFNTADITNYFIKRIACDGKSARYFKSINTKAFNLLRIGMMHRIFQGTLMTVSSRCLPETRLIK